jgi:putative transposase
MAIPIGWLACFFGAARWVWDTCLAWRTQAYRVYGERVTGVDFSREVTWLKHFAPYAWLASSRICAATPRAL